MPSFVCSKLRNSALNIWECHSQARPCGWPIDRFGVAPVQTHNLLDEIETQARASSTLLEAVERFKHLFTLFDRDAAPLVADLDPAGPRHPDQDRATTTPVIDGVLHEIGQCPLERGL